MHWANAYLVKCSCRSSLVWVLHTLLQHVILDMDNLIRLVSSCVLPISAQPLGGPRTCQLVS